MRRALFLLVLLGLHACGSQPERTEDQLGKGDHFLAQGDTANAQAAYRLALRQDSLNPDILARLGRIYAGQGKSEPADIYLRRAADLTYQQGARALAAGDQAGARAAFEHTLAIISAHPLALLRLGDLSLAQGQEDKALGYFEQAIQANPEYGEGYVKSGKLHLRQHRLAEARLAFERAIELNVNAVDAYLGLGELHTLQGNPSAAAEQYRKVLLINPRSPLAQAALAQLGSNP
jgi:tetratricopeptide (TPR) repeat protein